MYNKNLINLVRDNIKKDTCVYLANCYSDSKNTELEEVKFGKQRKQQKQRIRILNTLEKHGYKLQNNRPIKNVHC